MRNAKDQVADQAGWLGELKIINAVEMLHVVERKRSKPTNTGCRGGFSHSLSANCNFPLTRDMTTFWVLFALLITFRHARRFVCACFSRKQATDHNHSTNRNRSSEQTNSALIRAAGDVCALRHRITIYGLSNATSVNKCSVSSRLFTQNGKRTARYLKRYGVWHDNFVWLHVSLFPSFDCAGS
ncbi:hypothetical protein ALC60_04065 [Trachymyrmex zeteki]|uniref:Uncharacterized protein n=1 Tax=Mycetomoellerius zeteki TaxID=64791 RepID=A0A151X9M6_9HYME|nr:hypothetical protein ALC60_04065 [Trachymyrmex zeteki]